MRNVSKANRVKKEVAALASGFTLVELLVVISIIALLLAILMPSLQAAREQAKSLVCRANLKQIGMTTIFYTDDNDTYFPIGKMSNWAAPGNKTVAQRLADYIPLEEDEKNWIWTCPSDRYPWYPLNVSMFPTISFPFYLSYALSGGDGAFTFPNGYGVYDWVLRREYFFRTKKPSRKTTEVRSPSSKILYLDCSMKEEYIHPDGSQQGENVATATTNLSEVHPKGVNIVFIDGHAETVREKDDVTFPGYVVLPAKYYKVK